MNIFQVKFPLRAHKKNYKALSPGLIQRPSYQAQQRDPYDSSKRVGSYSQDKVETKFYQTQNLPPHSSNLQEKIKIYHQTYRSTHQFKPEPFVYGSVDMKANDQKIKQGKKSKQQNYLDKYFSQSSRKYTSTKTKYTQGQNDPTSDRDLLIQRLIKFNATDPNNSMKFKQFGCSPINKDYGTPNKQLNIKSCIPEATKFPQPGGRLFLSVYVPWKRQSVELQNKIQLIPAFIQNDQSLRMKKYKQEDLRLKISELECETKLSIPAGSPTFIYGDSLRKIDFKLKPTTQFNPFAYDKNDQQDSFNYYVQGQKNTR